MSLWNHWQFYGWSEVPSSNQWVALDINLLFLHFLNCYQEYVPRPIARISVTVVTLAVVLFVLKSFLSTAFFALVRCLFSFILKGVRMDNSWNISYVIVLYSFVLLMSRLPDETSYKGSLLHAKISLWNFSSFQLNFLGIQKTIRKYVNIIERVLLIMYFLCSH